MPLRRQPPPKVWSTVAVLCLAALLSLGTAGFVSATEETCLHGATCDSDLASAAADDDDASLHLLQRRGAYLLGHPGAAAAAPAKSPAAPVPTQAASHEGPLRGERHLALLDALARADVLGAVVRTRPPNAEPEVLVAVARAYASLPAFAVYGLPLVLGPGLVQVSIVATFWAVIRPAAAALEVLLPRPDCPGCPQETAARGSLPAAYATAAHFYWTWGLLELASRRRPLPQRLGAVALLAAAILPVPLAQVWLGDRSGLQAAAGALLGAALGALFFLALRLPLAPLGRPSVEVQACSEAKRTLGGAVVRWATPHDNLSDFWGGSIWQPWAPPAWLPKCSQEPPRAG